MAQLGERCLRKAEVGGSNPPVSTIKKIKGLEKKFCNPFFFDLMHIPDVHPSCPISAARKHFPRGLTQPEHGFRFSVDALLLACFAATGKPRHVVDLGAGCGVVGFGLLLTSTMSDCTVQGLDNDPAMVAAMHVNARDLGFADQVSPVLADVRDITQTPSMRPASSDLVVCNPPYRTGGSGRLPADGPKQAAGFEINGRLEDFIAAAAWLLKTKGKLCMVYLPENLNRLFSALSSVHLEPKRLRLVHGHQSRPARLVLVEARKEGRPGLMVEPPLVLHRKEAKGITLTSEAMAFCPFLACNPVRLTTDDPQPKAEDADPPLTSADHS